MRKRTKLTKIIRPALNVMGHAKFPGESLLDVFINLANYGEKQYQYGWPILTIMKGANARNQAMFKQERRYNRNLELNSRQIQNPGIVVAGIPNANRHEHINADYTFWTNHR